MCKTQQVRHLANGKYASIWHNHHAVLAGQGPVVVVEMLHPRRRPILRHRFVYAEKLKQLLIAVARNVVWVGKRQLICHRLKTQKQRHIRQSRLRIRKKICVCLHRSDDVGCDFHAAARLLFEVQQTPLSSLASRASGIEQPENRAFRARSYAGPEPLRNIVRGRFHGTRTAVNVVATLQFRDPVRLGRDRSIDQVVDVTHSQGEVVAW